MKDHNVDCCFELHTDNCPLPKVTEPINGSGQLIDVDLPSFQIPTDRRQQHPHHHRDNEQTVDYSRYRQYGGRESDHSSPTRLSSDYGDDEEDGATSGDGHSVVRGRHGRRQDGSRSVPVAATSYQAVGRGPTELESRDGGDSLEAIGGRPTMFSNAVVGERYYSLRLFPVTTLSVAVIIVTQSSVICRPKADAR